MDFTISFTQTNSECNKNDH